MFFKTQNGFTGTLSAPGLVIGDGAKTGPALAAPNGAGTDFAIDGLAYHKADAGTVIPFPAGTTIGLLSTGLFLVCIDSAGTVTFVQGTPVLTADLVSGVKVLDWPDVPEGLCPLGAIKVACINAATFVPGTTALDASDVTETYYNFGAGMPTRPLTS